MWRLRWFFAMYWLLQYWHWYFFMFEWEFMWWFNSDCVKYLEKKSTIINIRRCNLQSEDQLTSYRTVRTSMLALDDDANGEAWELALRRKAYHKRGMGCAGSQCGWFDEPLSSNYCRKLKVKVWSAGVIVKTIKHKPLSHTTQTKFFFCVWRNICSFKFSFCLNAESHPLWSHLNGRSSQCTFLMWIFSSVPVVKADGHWSQW